MASVSRSSHSSQRRPSTPLRTLSTPYDGKTQSRNAAASQQNGGEWVEPPLRNPAPSFQDHPGTTRQGVLETMMPLGTLPTTKVKARAKGDSLRSVVQARNLGGLIVDEERVTPEAGAVSDSTRAGSLRTDGRSLRGSPAVETAGDGEDAASPSAQTNNSSGTAQGQRQQAGVTPKQNSPVQQPRPETPASRAAGIIHSPVPTDSPYLTAVALANRNGSPEVQHPLAFLYTVAERDPELTRLLESAVNDGSINDPDSKLYRKIKAVKKMFRSAQSSPRSRAGSAAALRGGSGAESSRAETARASVSPSGGANHNTTASVPKQEPIHTQHQTSHNSPPTQTRAALRIKLNVNPTSSSTPNGIPTSPAASPAKESVEHTAFLSRRSSLSSSSSSSSSLSSADSEVLNQPPPTMEFPSTKLKRSSADAALPQEDDPEVEAARKRMKLDMPKVEAQQSNIRNPPAASSAAPRTRSRRATPRVQSYPPNDVLPKDHQIEPDNVAAGGKRSRHQTPTTLGRPPKKQKVAPRTKTSPVKNQKRPAVAGIARPDNKRRGSIGNNADDSESSENNDYCSACGGPGFLLCCDGCDRSFHFSCLDPPFESEEHFDSKWFCSVCEARREPTKKLQAAPQPGLFTELQNRIEKNNPRAFRLPEGLRAYFKNIKTGTDGEYVDDPDTRAIPTTNTRIGYDDAPNFKALKDSKGNTILCHSCGKSSGGTRDIIPCDYCSLYWHLDCLNPPLANPPNRGPYQHEKKRYAWMCPAHVDHDLRNLDPIDGLGVRHDGNLRSHRVRRPKKTKIVRPYLRRGLANNGLIEVESDLSDDSGFETDELEDGTVYKLPRKGIVLDFIHKVKENRLNEERQIREQNAALQAQILSVKAENARKLSQDIRSRQFKERQTAFNLAHFKANNTDLNLFDDEVENLIATLEAEAPREVSAQMDEAEFSTKAADGKHGLRGLPSPASSSVPEISAAVPTTRQREVLLRMQSQIASLLAAGANDE